MLEILTYEFIQKGLIGGVIIAITCSFMGTFLVLRRYSLFGDGIAHVAFGGIAIGLFSGIFPFWTAFVVSILGALGLQKLKQYANMSGDAAIAVMLAGGVAVGIILISASTDFSTDIFDFLFGSILLIDLEELSLVGIVCGIVLILLLALYKPLLHMTFNEEQALVSGINTSLLNYLFVAIAAVTIVISMKLVGVLLISALIVIPNITAMMFGRGFKTTVILATMISAVSVLVGILVSFYLDLAPSGTIVIIIIGTLLATIVIRAKTFGNKIRA